MNSNRILNQSNPPIKQQPSVSGFKGIRQEEILRAFNEPNAKYINILFNFNKR